MRYHMPLPLCSIAAALAACSPDTEGTGGAGGTTAPPDATSTTTTTDLESDATTAVEDPFLPAAPELGLTFSQVKQFDFNWTHAPRVEYYQFLERLPGAPEYSLLRDELADTKLSLTMPLHLRWGARYVVRACNAHGCVDSAPVEVIESMVDAIGFFKASNTDADDHFGYTVALSADGGTLAVGAPWEASGSAGVDGDQADDSQPGAGAVYVFAYTDGAWAQQGYIKASNPGGGDGSMIDVGDEFGFSLALSADGDVLAVGAPWEASAATGVDGDQTDDSCEGAGAVYVFERSVGVWSQRAYIKASNTSSHDYFGNSVALSGDGGTLAIGAPFEASSATGIDGDQTDESFGAAGAVYVFVRTHETWTQQAYVKASDTTPAAYFGGSVALSTDGDTLAVSAPPWYFGGTGSVYVFARESGVWSQMDYFIGLDGDDNDQFGRAIALSGDGRTLAVGAPGVDEGTGVVHVFARIGEAWLSQAAVRSNFSAPSDGFGASLALSANGEMLAVGAALEASVAVGINGDHTDTEIWWFSGAVYVLERIDRSWLQRSYVKASNTNPEDTSSSTNTYFGKSVALSADGHTLAAGGSDDASAAVGIGGDETDRSAPGAGAVYLY